MSRFSIQILDTQSSAASLGERFGDRIVGLRVSTALPGGCHEANFRVPGPITTIPEWFGFNYTIKIRDELGVFWAGRIEDFTAHRGPDGYFWDVRCLGYGANADDQLYASQDVSNLFTSTIVSNVRTALMPQVTAESITASNYKLSAATAVTLKLLKGHEVINFAALFGDSAKAAQIWYIYSDNDGTIRLTFKPRPTVADLYMRHIETEVIEFGLVGRRLYNKVTVQYNNGAATVSVNDSTLQGAGPAGWKLIREAKFYLPPITQEVDATQVANVLLTAFKTARLAAKTMQIKSAAQVLDSNLQRVAPWRWRAGQLVQITDIVPASPGPGQLTYNNSFLIVGTSYDEDAQMVTITPEAYDMTIEMVLAKAAGVLEGRWGIQAA